MGIIRTTAYPSRYAELSYWDEGDAGIMEQERSQAGQYDGPQDWPQGNLQAIPSDWPYGWPQYTKRSEDAYTDKLRAAFNVAGAHWNAATAQRDIAQALGRAMDAKPVYHRYMHGSVYDRGEYAVNGWLVHKNFVETDLYEPDDLPIMLRALQALAECGYTPDGTFTLHYVPERFDLAMAFNACTMLEARHALIEMALGFEEEAMLIVDEDLAFSLPLNAFSLPIIEACAFLLCRVSAIAMTTKKARMQPCDMVNPKYQMRSWLLRLGFIGKKYERPRHTLLDQLEGNAAFFDDVGKQRAKDKRRLRKAMTLM